MIDDESTGIVNYVWSLSQNAYHEIRTGLKIHEDPCHDCLLGSVAATPLVYEEGDQTAHRAHGKVVHSDKSPHRTLGSGRV